MFVLSPVRSAARSRSLFREPRNACGACRDPGRGPIVPVFPSAVRARRLGWEFESRKQLPLPVRGKRPMKRIARHSSKIAAAAMAGAALVPGCSGSPGVPLTNSYDGGSVRYPPPLRRAARGDGDLGRAPEGPARPGSCPWAWGSRTRWPASRRAARAPWSSPWRRRSTRGGSPKTSCPRSCRCPQPSGLGPRPGALALDFTVPAGTARGRVWA